MNAVFLVPFFPLVGCLVNGLLRTRLSKSASGWIACGAVLASFVISVVLFTQVNQPGFQTQVVSLFEFIRSGSLNIAFSFQVDPLSVLFLLIITGVGFLIHLYSVSYMHEERAEHVARYFSYLNLFIFSMLLLVLGSNFVIMFIGWEGVGLCSYLLIGYWFKVTEFDNAARKAFVMNRIGDLGFLLAIFWMIHRFGSTDFSVVFSQAPSAPTWVLTGISILLFVGATGKSAQIPLYTWLPDAMAGPTPVSALIHAATMVTAGIYMIARSNIIYTLAPSAQTVVAVTGLATAILGATIALKQNDIKKVLAYSTVSQLGYMFLGLGAGAYAGAVFHVLTHAFFKALLFLAAGSVIHALGGEQDIRKMGGLKKQLPVTQATFLIGCLAISGIPPLSGFFSKDEILSAAYSKHPLYWILGALTALVTAFYMFRLYATTFLGGFRGTDQQLSHAHESPLSMRIPLVVLAVLSAVGGLIGIPAVFASNGHWLERFLAPVFEASTNLRPHLEAPGSQELTLMAASAVLCLIGVVVAWSRFSKKPDLAEPRGLGKVLAEKWYVDEIYEALVTKPVNALAKFLNNIVEKSMIDELVNGIGRLVLDTSRQIRLLQSGQVGAYVLLMVIGIVGLFLIELFLKR